MTKLTRDNIEDYRRECKEERSKLIKDAIANGTCARVAGSKSVVKEFKNSWPITNSMTLYCSKRLPVLACVQRSQMFWFNWMKTNIQFSMQIWNPATLKTLWPRRSSKRRSFEICYSKIRLKEEKINFTRAVIKFKIGGNWEKRRIKDIIFATVDGCPY